ncbi:dipeptidase [Aquisediminimonas profunda]|uniref:dipeptidase n=1 Tax=Aquisediminimonas profunda TaxID=1550733 RepID=UPI001C62D391|nr:dipeptidase [Aquisediminimonas profunda]
MRRVLKWLLILLVVALACFFLFAPGIVERSMNKVEPVAAKAGPRALALHKTLAIADMHSDTLMWQRDVLDRASRGHVDLPRLEDGHVALQVFSSVSKTPKGQNYDANGSDSDNITLLTIAQLQPPRTWSSILERSLYHASKLQSAADNSAGRLRFIRTSADLAKLLADRARGEQVTGAIFSVEGLQNLEGKLANLDRLQAAGMRMAGLTHFFDNEVAGSMHGIKKGGLTPLGRQVVTELERRHIIVDIAHASHKTVADVLAMATRPVVSSHGGVQATCKVNRNLTDDEIRGVAKTGGVIGIGYWDAAVCGTEPAKVAQAIAHVRDLVGIDYVGLGSDFDGATTTGFDTSKLALVTQALMDRGFSDADIAKVMGGNVLRVLGQVLPPR